VAVVLTVRAGATAAPGGDQVEILAQVNESLEAESLLTRARQMATGGDYVLASQCYLELARRHGGSVVRSESLLYRPVWRQVVDDLSAWPEGGLKAYRSLVDDEAAAVYREAASSGDLVALERLVQTNLLSSSGNRAATALAERLVESGRFSLAAYYYLLILDSCGDSADTDNLLRTKALVALKLAGCDSRAEPVARRLKGHPPGLLGEDALDRIDRMAAEPATPDPHLGGRDHLIPRPTVVPAAVAWVCPLTTRVPHSNYALVSTPLACAAFGGGRLYATLQTSLWCLRPGDGAVLWRHDTDGRTGDEDPAYYYCEQAHRPLVTGGAVITPISSGGRTGNKERVDGVINLMAFSPDDGRPLWTFSPRGMNLGGPGLAVDTGPVLDSQHIFVPLATMTDLFGSVQTAAVDRWSGELLWHQGIGAHDNQLVWRKPKFHRPSMPLSTGLQLREGLLLSCGGGLVTAQSALSGTILWCRQVPQRSFNFERRPLNDRPGISIFSGQVGGRRQQALSKGRIVVAGDASARDVVACDLLTGELIWSQPTADAGQPVAVAGDKVVMWGRSLVARDVATGQTRWEVTMDRKEVIAGTPLVTQSDVYVPTDRCLLIVRLSDGRTQHRIPWPEGRLPGDLLLLPEGLVVIEPRNVVMYEPRKADAESGGGDAAAGRPAAEVERGEAHPPLEVVGGFENAMVHGVRVEDARGKRPTVVIGGEQKRLDHQAVATRHPHKYYHYHLKLLNTAGRTVRFRYGPFPGSEPHVSCLKTPVVYYDPVARAYEPVIDVRAEVVFLGERDEDRPKKDYWGSSIVFSHRFRKDTAYLCQSYPFTNEDMDRLAAAAAANPNATVVEVGKSKHDRLSLRQVVVTDPDVPAAEKRGVWLHAGEDPWEFPGVIACAGAARWAMCDDPVAREFRRHFVLYAMPIVQPDAVRRGWTNYSLDAAYTNFINFGWSYDRTDVPEHDMIAARVRAMREAALPVDYAESMHSSISWSSFIRYQHGGEAESRRFVEEHYNARYVPWNAWTSYLADEKSRARFAHVTKKSGLVAFMKAPYPKVLYHISHTEQIIFPVKKLPGFPEPPFPAWGRTEWTDEDTRNMRGQMISHRASDIEDWGIYRLLALTEFFGHPVDPKRLPPQLICGDVDGYASSDGRARVFTVLYRDVAGREPTRVTLHLADGSQHEMVHDCGTSALCAIRFKATAKVAKGKTYDFHFTASNGATEVRYPRAGSFLGPYVTEAQ